MERKEEGCCENNQEQNTLGKDKRCDKEDKWENRRGGDQRREHMQISRQSREALIRLHTSAKSQQSSNYDIFDQI